MTGPTPTTATAHSGLPASTRAAIIRAEMEQVLRDYDVFDAVEGLLEEYEEAVFESGTNQHG